MTARTLNVGIIGFGMIGKVHAFGYRTLPFYSRSLSIRPRITLTATSRPETAAVAGNLLDCDVTTDFREITENPEIDIVHVCSPNACHAEAVLSAIAHGKHLYCDKPLTATLDDAKRIEAALLATDANGKRRYDRTNQMTFHLRFFPAIMMAKRLITGGGGSGGSDKNGGSEEEASEKSPSESGLGRIGRIFQYRISYLHASNAKASSPFKWKFDVGGGVIRDLGAHLIDLIDDLIGLPTAVFADSMTAFSRRPDAVDPTRFHDVAVEDAVTVLTRGIDRRTGASYRGIIEATKLATGNEDDVRFEISGERGSMRFSLMNPHYLDFFDATTSDRPFGGESGWRAIPAGARYDVPHTEFPSPKSTTGWVRAHVACLVNFLAAVSENRPASPDLLQGVRVQTVLDAVERSVQTEKWVSL